MDRDGPQAPGNAQKNPRPDGHWVGTEQLDSELPALVRERVRAIVTRHGLSTLVGMRGERAPVLPACDPAAIAHIADLAMAGDGPALRSVLTGYIDAGYPNSALLLDLLAPAVRLIGTYWEEDRCSFATSTVSTGLIQRIVYELTEANRRPIRTGAHRALVAVTPGDQHTFGAVVVSELLRAAGWFVLTRLVSSENELCDDVAGDDFSVIAFSLSRTSRIADLRRTIARIRAGGSAGRAIFAAGGRVFTDGEADAADVGADVVAVDAPELIRLMDETSTFVAAD